MSTRSQLRFVERVDQDGEPTDDDRVAQVYRHSDGYPERVLRDLTQLKELLDATRAERGPGYRTQGESPAVRGGRESDNTPNTE